MALNFPSSPALGQVYSAGDRSWQWNGAAWETYSFTLAPSQQIIGVDAGSASSGDPTVLKISSAPFSPVGDLVGTTDPQVLTNKTISAGVYTGVVDQTGSVRGNIVDLLSGTQINCAAGNYFICTVAGNVTFTTSNVPVSRVFAFTLEIVHTSGSITWFSGVQWPGGTAPSLTTGKVHLFTFVTDDGGTSWRGASQINYSA